MYAIKASGERSSFGDSIKTRSQRLKTYAARMLRAFVHSPLSQHGLLVWEVRYLLILYTANGDNGPRENENFNCTPYGDTASDTR